MLKNMKAKALALFAVLVLAVGALCTATPAMAAGNTGTITVTSNSKEFKDKTVSAYQVFKVDNGSYVLNDTFKKFFVDECGLTEDETLSSKAFEYVNALGNKDSKNVIEFAKKMRAWVLAQEPAVATTGTGKATESSSKYVATITVDPGYYLVVPALGSTGNNDRGTDAMLTNVVADETASIELKSEYPTVSKTVNGEHGTMNQIGKEIEFTVKSKVPDTTNYKKYNMKFTDTFSDGLTFVPGSVKVTIGGDTMAATTDYTVTAPAGGSNTLTIDLVDVIEHIKGTKGTQYATGEDIVITYKAKLNEKAIDEDANPETNEVKINYSNDPDGGYDGVTEVDKDKVYTFDIDLHKYAAGNESAYLAGAEFKLYDNEQAAKEETANAAIKFVKVSDKKYRVATAEEIASPGSLTVTDTIVTVDTGMVNIDGLGEGDYWLKETKAPSGFNKPADPFKININATFEADGTLESSTVTVDTTPNTADDHTVKIENRQGTLLPGTGGMGTVIFTVIGVAVIAGGAAWYVSRRRSSGAHNA